MCCVGGHLKVLGSTPSMISDVLYGTSPFCQSLSPHLRGPPNIHSPSSRSFFCRQRRAVLRRLRVTRVRTRSASGPFSRAHLTAPYTSMILLFLPVTFCASQLHARVSLPQPLQFGKAKTPTPHAARSRRPGRGSGPQNCARATASSPLASTTAPYTPVEVPPDLVLAPQNPAPPPAVNRQRPSRPMYYAAHTRGAFSTPFTAL